MLRITGPEEVARVEIVMNNLNRDSVAAIKFHLLMELEEAALSLSIFDNGLQLRGAIPVTKNPIDICRTLVIKISKILNIGFTGVIIIENQIFDYGVQP